MRYLGGKSKIAKKITAAILAHTDRRGLLIEPFCGGGAMTAALAPHFDRVDASDIVEDLILMWQALQDGWQPPRVVTEAEHATIKHAPPSALRAFIRFGCSYGGVFSAGFARGNGQNYADESARALLRDVALAAKHTSFRVMDYKKTAISAGCVVYADPPYAGKSGYQNAFDNDEFWRIADGWAASGADVFVSEYAAPSGWPCVWGREMPLWMRGGKSVATKVVERLFFKPGVRGSLSASLARLGDAVERLTAALT